MVQRLLSRREVLKDSGAAFTHAAHESRPLAHECQTRKTHIAGLLTQYKDFGITDILLLDRSSDPPKTFTVGEAETRLREVNPHDYVRGKEDQGRSVVRAQSTPRTGPHARGRKRTIFQRSSSLSSSSSSSPRTKRRKRYQEVGTPSETSDDEDHVSDAADELGGVLDDENTTFEQVFKVADLRVYFYAAAFRAIGQLGCKHIVKSWIRTCHPKKQSSHPYNGGDSKETSQDLHGFGGALTTPDYWPSQHNWREGQGCRHKEPDHIKKPERIMLLVHLLCCGHPKFTLEKMRLATAQIGRDHPQHFTAYSIKLLKRIYDARALEIRHKEGGIDGDTRFSACLPKQPIKAQKCPKQKVPPRVKKEHLPQRPRKRTSPKRPIASTGTSPVGGNDDQSAVSMEGRPQISMEPVVDSTPASIMTNVVCNGVDLPLIQHETELLQHELPMPILTVSDHLQLNNRLSDTLIASREDQEAVAGRATVEHFGGIANEREPNFARKQSRITYENRINFDNTREANERRQSQPCRSEYASRTPASRKQDCGNLYDPHNSHLQVSYARQSRQDVHSTGNPTAYAHGQAPRFVAANPVAFSGSSSGLAGLPLDDSWQSAGDFPSIGQDGLSGPGLIDGSGLGAYMSLAPSHFPQVNSSFGSEYTDSSFGGGLQTNAWNQPSSMATRQDLSAEFRQQYLTSLPLGLNALSMESEIQNDATVFPQNHSMDLDNKYFPHAHDHRQW